MSSPTSLSLKEIQRFISENGGKVTNHSLVKHFKPFLTNTDTRDAARVTFKQYVNTLAVVKMENNEKYIVLKDEYCSFSNPSSPIQDKPQYETSVPEQLEEVSFNQSVNDESFPIDPPAPIIEQIQEEEVILRRKSIPKQSIEPIYHYEPIIQSKCEVISDDAVRRKSDQSEPLKEEKKEDVVTGSMSSLTDSENIKLSVKEGIKKFSKSTTDGINMLRQPSRKYRGGEEDDKTSVVSLDQVSHNWITLASQCDYSKLAKMAAEAPKLLTIKDPFLGYTALHWAAKRGHEDLVKLLAGSAPSLVHMKSMGGYTPLHIAMQYKHENLGNLLKDVYGADANCRDYSGRKPRDYLKNEGVVVPQDVYRKNKNKKKHNDKDLGFLRIGSLNMRVKKTTEAFSNFLGVGAGSRGYKGVHSISRNGMPMEIMKEQDPASEEALSKPWGSADNIRNEKGKVLMPPPLFTKIKRKKKFNNRQELNSSSPQSRSTPSTPNEVRSVFNEDNISNQTDFSGSDSDTACGFDANWQRK